jgi:hypothetical protein
MALLRSLALQLATSHAMGNPVRQGARAGRRAEIGEAVQNMAEAAGDRFHVHGFMFVNAVVAFGLYVDSKVIIDRWLGANCQNTTEKPTQSAK